MSVWLAVSFLAASLGSATTVFAASSINVLTGAANPLEGFGAAVGGSGGNNKFIAADFDGDGYTDLVNRNSANTGVQYWRNNGNGTFTELTGTGNPFRNVTLAGTAANYFSALYLTVGDFDGDGDIDVFNANHRTSTETAAPAMYRNDGGVFTVLQGSGTNPLQAFAVAVGTNSSKSIAADFDGDGDTDLVNRNSASTGVQYWRNNGNGTFTELTGAANPLAGVTFTANAAYFTTSSLAAGDFDGDGDMDIFNANHGGSAAMYRNDEGTFTVLQGAAVNPLHAFGGAIGTLAGNFVAGDFNGDGLVDLVNRISANTGLQFWNNNGDGSFTELTGNSNPFHNVTYPGTTVNHFFIGFLGVGDFDGDGDTDIVNVNSGGSSALYQQSGSPSAPSTIVAYPVRPGAAASSSYTLTVNGQPIFVEKFGDISFARFSYSGTANLNVTANQAVAAYEISPKNYQIQGVNSGNNLTFSITQPRTLVVTVNNLEKLLLFADSLETGAPDIHDANVINLADYMPANRDPEAAVTSYFQQAIDATSALNNGAGGVLYVPDGKYMTAQLKLKSNVHLYLQSGAWVRAVPDFNSTNYPVQQSSDSSFIFIGHADHVKISGRGIIDGNGYTARTLNDKANIKLLRTADATDLQVQDVYFLDSARWTLHLLYAQDVVMQNIKVINDLRGAPDPASPGVLIPTVTNTDGIDIDASQNVIVEGAFIYTGDDAISPKVTNYMNLKRPTTGLTIKNNVFWSLKSAFKIGDETLMDINDITFENNEIIYCDRFAAVWAGDEGHISNINLLNNRAEFVGGNYNERIFYYRIQLRTTDSNPGLIDGVTVKDFNSLNSAKQSSSIAGYDAAHPITNLTFDNIVINGVQAADKTDFPLEFKNAFYDNVIFQPSGRVYSGSLPETVITTPQNASFTTDTTPTVNGTTVVGSTVSVFIDNNPPQTVIADGSGNFSYTPSVALAEGAHTVKAKAIDPIGNPVQESSVFSFTVDLTAPAAPVISRPANSSHTFNTKQSISGTAEAKSIVNVYIDSGSPGMTTADINGNWSYTPSEELSIGNHSVIASTSDLAGNVSPFSSETMFTVELATPIKTTFVEAEDMTLLNYVIDSTTYAPASGGKVIKVSGTGTASTQLDEVDGIYDVKVHYFDENDGKATYKLYVNGTQVDAWTADQDLGSASVADVTKTFRLVSGLTLKRGDIIKLEGKSEVSEAARVDRLEFVLLAESTIPGSISGTVLDSQGAPLAGVHVQATRNGITPADVYQAFTNSLGMYTLTHTPTGTYTITMHKEGFTDNTATGVAVADAAVTGVNLTLQPAAPPHLNTVQVSGSIPALTAGGTGYDLSGLTVTGMDQYGNAYSLTGLTGTWSVKAGTGFASIMNGVLTPITEGTGTVVVTVGGKESNEEAFTVLSVAASTPRVLQVDQRGLTSGAYLSIAEAIASTPPLKPGDIVSLVPGSGPYHETVQLHVSGIPGKPIIFEGNGETIDGFTPFQFTRETDGKWTYMLPAPIPVTTAGSSSTFRHLITYNGQRLLLDQAYGQNAGIFTSDFVTLSADGTKLILNPDKASPSSGWKISTLMNGVEIVDPDAYQTYRNLHVTGVQNDGFNVHGSGTALRFENIEAFNNFDEGYSSHDSTNSIVDGGEFWQNENGIYNQTNNTIAFTANNVKMYNNIGFGLATQGGTNSFANIQSWDNGISNIRLGGTINTVNVVTYDSRWTQRPWVGYQETQDYTYNVEIKPYAYSERSPVTKTGTAVTVLPAIQLPHFMGAFDDWCHIYFTTVEQSNINISGPDADPDGDGLTNYAEYEAGSNPKLTDTPDVTPPAAPDVASPANQSVTNDVTPAYSGTAEPNSIVTVIVDGAAEGTVAADANGYWSYTPAAVLANGGHTVKATAKDMAGNISQESSSVSFTVDTTYVPVPIQTTTVEAEAMTLSGYAVESTTYPSASGGKVIKVSGTGTASTQLDGEDGIYDLKVQYFDENDGEAAYRAFVNGNQVDAWIANQDLGSGSVSDKSRTTHTISGVQLKRWDTVTIEGTSNVSENARIDKLDFMLMTVSSIPGSITGTVRNSQGIALPGAFVQASREGAPAQELYRAYSDSQGVYTITHAPAGTYTVTASKAGYLEHAMPAVHVVNSGAVGINLILQSVAVPVLNSVQISGTIPTLFTSEAGYNLANLTVTGKDQFGNSYDLSGLSASWVIKTGPASASLNGTILTPVASGAGTVAVTVGGKESNPLGFMVQTPRVLLVDQRGLTSGAYHSIAEAVASTPALKPGDMISLVPGSGPYHETIVMHASGIAGKPIIFDGNGELISGFTPFQFTQEASGQWTYTLPAPIAFTTPGNSSTFRQLVAYNGQRLMLDQAYGQNAGIFTSDYATLSSDGTKLILNPDKASPTSGWEISTLTNGLEIVTPDSYQTYRNVRITGVQNDAFNIHGTGVELRFENIEAFNNFDEGFSSHDSTSSTVDGGVFWGNENGIYNMARDTVTFTANNVIVYNNIGYGIGTQMGTNSFTNVQVWDNGISNIKVGGRVYTDNVVTYNGRWSQRPWVGYQESQNYKYNQQIVPYAYSEYVKPDYPIIKSGTPPTILPTSQLPKFMGPFDDWRHIYFTTAEHSNLSVSGPDADPDGDGLTNHAEYEAGLNPKVKDQVDTTAPAAPVIASPANGTVTNDTLLTYSGTAEAGSTVTVIVDGSTVGTSIAVGGVWSYTPAAVLTAGSHTVKATAKDTAGNMSEESVSIVFTVSTVVNPGANNHKPVIAPMSPIIIDEDTDFTGTIQASDADNDPLMYTITQSPSKGVLSLVEDTNQFTYQPYQDVNGTDAFTIEVSDGMEKETAPVEVTIMPVNDAPAAESKAYSTDSLTPIFIMLTAFDAEQDPLTYWVTTQPSAGTVTATVYGGSQVLFTPDPGMEGIATFNFAVSDGMLSSNAGTISVQVGPAGAADLESPTTNSVSQSQSQRSAPEEKPMAAAVTIKEGSQTITTLTFNSDSVMAQLTTGGDKVVTVLLNTSSDVVIGELTGKLLKAMEQKNAIIEIQTDKAIYTLPASQIGTDRIAAAFGPTVSPDDVKIRIRIADAAPQTTDLVYAEGLNQNLEIVVKPVNFEVEAANGNHIVSISQFDSYVERTIPLPDGVDTKKVITGVVLEDNGNIAHVPTKVIVKDGRLFAVIKSLTNSTYTVVRSEHTYTDIIGHWSQADVSDMSSRLIVQGISDALFVPDRPVTRAEFAAIIVRALGMHEAKVGNAGSFRDVANDAWYAAPIGTSVSYGLMDGYENGLFEPDRTITRAEAMVVLARAMNITKLNTVGMSAAEGRFVNHFIDDEEVPEWAREAASALIQTGIVQGSGDKLQPASSLTRGETAALARRLLQKAGLID